MSALDWLVLIITIAAIMIYGLYRSRGLINIEGYFKGNNSMPWYAVGLSIMATQASAITFLSAPGQAFTDGMRFVQYYFGLPIAMIVIAAVFLPMYHRLKVFTAYEFLEGRFDLKTRSLAAGLFLVQRGLAAGLTIYAPSIILSSLLGWNIYVTNVCIGGLVLLYTYSGGTKAVSYTQLGQMLVILSGMVIAAIMIVKLLPGDMGFADALEVGGALGKMNVIDTTFDLREKYNVWSGIIGGFFLALSYFGTDQSQVGRYITGKNLNQMRMGLLFNGAVKIPMQFGILLIGVLLVAFYQFEKPPLFFNDVEVKKLENSSFNSAYKDLETKHTQLHLEKMDLVNQFMDQPENQQNLIPTIQEKNKEIETLRGDVKSMIKENNPLSDANDTNYIFLDFVTRYLPRGLIGLIIAVIFCASMSSTSAELNALSSTFIVDIYKRKIRTGKSSEHYLKASKMATFMWGIVGILVANMASQLGSLIEAVNVLGSLFYGTILGIFLTAFMLKFVKGNAVFIAALIAQATIFYCYFFTELTFLWFNLLGTAIVMGVGSAIQLVSGKQ